MKTIKLTGTENNRLKGFKILLKHKVVFNNYEQDSFIADDIVTDELRNNKISFTIL